MAVAFAACSKKNDVAPVSEVPRSVEVLPSVIAADMALDPNKDYSLQGQVYVKNNASLTIPAGVTVFVAKNTNPNDKSSLIVTSGSKLFVNGTEDKPVVFTSAALEKAPGDWGTIAILGKSVTNTGIGYVLGLPENDDTKYGGNDLADNSGSIRYLRVEYSGGINPSAEEEWGLDRVSGFALHSVGSGTTVDHVMVSNSRDDGFQFVGGTVNATHLIAYNNGDDDFDFDHGYTGKLQYVISYRQSLNSTHALRANALESYNDHWPTLNEPITRPVISNMTIVGPQGIELTPSNLNQGVYIRKGTKFVIENSIVAEYPKGGLMVCPKTRKPLIENNGSLFRNNLVQSDSMAKSFSFDRGWDPAGFYGVLADPELKDFCTDALNKNQVVATSDELKLTAMYSANGPDLTPLATSPALTGANFSDPDLSGFSVVPFRGAIGTSNWAGNSNWARWK